MDDSASGAVDDYGAGHHHSELVRADHALCFGGKWGVDGDEVGAFQDVFEGGDFGAVYVLAGFDERVVCDEVHTEVGGFVGDGASDASVSEDAEGGAAGAVHGLIEGHVCPASGFDLGVVLSEATVEGEDHADGVVGDFVHAVVGDVCDDDAEFGGGWDVDVVDTDAVSGCDHTLFGGFEDVPGDLREAEHDYVGVGCEVGESCFGGVGSDDGFDSACSEDFGFDVDVGPDVVGDEGFFHGWEWGGFG